MSSSAYPWLPEHHLGVAATLAHTDEIVGQVSDLLFDYQTQPGGIFKLEEQPGFPNTRTVVTRVAAIPRKVPMLVADALVALRAALEHVLFAEVEFRDGELGEMAARLVEVPACGTRAKFEEGVKGRARNGPALLQAAVTRSRGLRASSRSIAETLTSTRSRVSRCTRTTPSTGRQQ